MKRFAVLIPLVLFLPCVHSQNGNEAVYWAQQISKNAGELKDVAFQTPLDLHRSILFKQDDTAALIMPAVGVNDIQLKTAGTKPVPLGIVWFLGAKPTTIKHAAFADEKLQLATIQSNGERRLRGVLLAVRQNGDRMELLVFGRGQQPLIKIPMAERLLHQRSPIDILATSKGDRDYIVLHLYGRFMVHIPVVTGIN
ncbi:MAG: hypothetical protein ACPGVU_23880 [Limisphaerales bacterium]